LYYLLLKSLDDIQKKENFMKLGIENRSILEFEKNKEKNKQVYILGSKKLKII
jgi:hypothetical protein